jgi:omega-6 fatty acid desaturase (delta-12 desaturase)
MNEQDANLPVTGNPRALAQSLASYREPSCARSILEIAITALPLVLLWLLMWVSLDIGYWLCLLLSVPASGFSCAYL